MRWVLARKDFNDFWPIGLPTAGTAMGSSLVERVESALATRSPTTMRHPTTALILLFFSTYGLRSAAWETARRMRYVDRLLQFVRVSKVGPAVPLDGTHQLVLRWPRETIPWADATMRLDFKDSANRFAATLWAYSEAAYFCNHRIGTERHGPYPSDLPGGLVTLRSGANLTPRHLWPEIRKWPELPHGVWLAFDSEAATAPFDLFANPLFTFDASRTTRRVAVCVQRGPDEPVSVVDDANEVDAMTRELRRGLAQLLAVVDSLSVRHRALRLHQVMLSALDLMVGDRTFSNAREGAGDPVGPGARVEGALADLVSYYDLRQEFSDAAAA
jgi:hypothetical protein